MEEPFLSFMALHRFRQAVEVSSEPSVFRPSCVSSTALFLHASQQLRLYRAPLVPVTLPAAQYLLLFLPLLSIFFPVLFQTQVLPCNVQRSRQARTVWAAECPFFKPAT
jgi:hypothetical protein